MNVPLEVSYRGVEKTGDLDAYIRQQVDRLHRYSDRIMSCRIAVEHRQEFQGSRNPFRVRIEVTVPPGRDFVAKVKPGDRNVRENVRAVLGAAFKAMERQLKRNAELRRLVRRNFTDEAPTAVVARIFHDEGYGFLNTEDGREIYFHRNAVLNEAFQALRVGTEVRFAQEMGDDGLQASSVTVINRLGLRDTSGVIPGAGRPAPGP